MDALTFEIVRAGDAGLFELYSTVRTEELGMQDWDPVLRRQVLWLQFEAQRRGYFEQFPKADQHLILRAGAPIGWLIVDRSGPALHGIDMALCAEERNKGTGTSVIRALQAEAAALARPMVITVNTRNERALALYIRLGFRVVRETDIHTVMEWQR